MCSSKTSQGSYIFHIIVNNSFNINTALKYRGENCVHPKNERFVSAVPSLECLVVIRMWVSACLSFRASTWKILSSLPMDRGLSRPWLLESGYLRVPRCLGVGPTTNWYNIFQPSGYIFKAQTLWIGIRKILINTSIFKVLALLFDWQLTGEQGVVSTQ